MSWLRRRRSERGASLVELAVIAPLIIMLGMGVLEFGLAWRDSLTISNTLRSGARVGSNSGDDRLADYNTLKQVEAAIEQIPNTRILRIVIFKSTTSNGAVPTACASGTSVTNVCNVYTAAQMDTLTEADFDQPDCDGDPDESWCPTTRQNSQALGADYLGVYVMVQRDWITNVFPGTGLTMTDTTVMRLEPRFNVDDF